MRAGGCRGWREPGLPALGCPLGLPRPGGRAASFPTRSPKTQGVRDLPKAPAGAQEGSDPPGWDAYLLVFAWAQGALVASAVPRPARAGFRTPDREWPPPSDIVTASGCQHSLSVEFVRPLGLAWLCHPPDAGPLRAAFSSPMKRVGWWNETDLPLHQLVSDVPRVYACCCFGVKVWGWLSP